MKLLVPPQSGSIAGQTASRNRYGQYMRTRAIPVNPNTAFQQSIRASFGTASAAWRSLTEAEQLAWQTYAQAHPHTDSLGQQIILTGAQMFIGINNRLAAVDLAQVVDVPADPAPDPLLTMVITATAPATISIAFTPTPVPASTTFQFFASAPLSPGVSYPGQFKQIDRLSAAGTSPLAIGALYVARWGNFAVGQRIYFRAVAVRTDGAYSAPLTADDIAA